MEVIHEMLTQKTPVSCNKWARDLKKTWQSSSIFTITVSFLISLCVEVLKIRSLSIQMVRETGIMSKILFTSTFYILSCFCSLRTALSLYLATSVYMLYLLQRFVHLLDLCKSNRLRHSQEPNFTSTFFPSPIWDRFSFVTAQKNESHYSV